MATELTVFTGSQFVGKPVLTDVEFGSSLQRIECLQSGPGICQGCYFWFDLHTGDHICYR